MTCPAVGNNSSNCIIAITATLAVAAIVIGIIAQFNHNLHLSQGASIAMWATGSAVLLSAFLYYCRRDKFAGLQIIFDQDNKTAALTYGNTFYSIKRDLEENKPGLESWAILTDSDLDDSPKIKDLKIVYWERDFRSADRATKLLKKEPFSMARFHQFINLSE